MVHTHGMKWGLRVLNEQVVSLLSTKFWLAKDPKQAPHDRGFITIWEKFVFATLDFANFPYATLNFDISVLPLLAFEKYHNCHYVAIAN